jgi:hypothetical protein
VRKIGFTRDSDGIHAAEASLTPYDGAVAAANIRWITTLNNISADRSVRKTSVAERATGRGCGLSVGGARRGGIVVLLLGPRRRPRIVLADRLPLNAAKPQRSALPGRPPDRPPPFPM